MEGTLFVPPERGAFIGRALWKARHVVVGPAQRGLPADGPSHQTGPNRPLPDASGAIYLSIYKSKEDVEPVQQHAISSITECQVQMLAHRKQGPVLPTLVVNISPDPATDKLRKRRSSRTAGLTTTRETNPTTLCFRTAPDESHRLQEWLRYIQSLVQSYPMDRHPISPVTPSSPTFINPFSPRSREPSDYYQRPPSANHNSRTALQHNTSSQTYSSRDRPVTFSEAPSLRSKRSDVSSSQTSSMNHSHVNYNIPGQHYTTVFPTDLPSPATTVGEYQGGFIEGWTSAQGRASTLSSPIRGRDSISSQPVLPSQHTLNSSSPPGPRETILDRAFQLRVIPGSELEVPGEEKLSSLARFDALMREADERRRQREADERARAAKAAHAMRSAQAAENGGLRSAWDLDEDEDEDEDGPIREVDEDDDAHERDLDDDVAMPRTAQRALDYIAGRHQPTVLRSPISYDHDTLMVLNSGSSSQLRPQTGYSRSRPGIAQRTYSQPQLAAAQRYLPHVAAAPGGVPEDESTAAAAFALHRSATEKPPSGASGKRLSLTEFTRRLSSTSSLLLVQNNTSSPSSRGSSVADAQQQHCLSPSTRGVPGHDLSAVAGDEDREKKCGWRGSVGVDGSFL